MGQAVSNVYEVATERYLEPVFKINGSPIDGTFDLWAQENIDEVVLSVELRLRESSAKSHFRNCSFNLVEYSRESRRSDAHKMTAGPDYSFSVNRTIRKSEEFGSLIFYVVAVRNTGAVLDKISSAIGVIVGESEPRYVHVDESPERGGNFIRVKWVDFDKHYPSIRRNSHHLVFDGGVPYLALNSQLTSWRTVMESKGTRGQRASIREHSYSVIVADVWSVLLARTLTRLGRVILQREDFDPEIPGLDPINDLEWWEAKMLALWMPRHYRFGAGDNWKQKLFDDIRSGGLQHHQLSATIQRHAELGNAFEGVVQKSVQEIESP